MEDRTLLMTVVLGQKWIHAATDVPVEVSPKELSHALKMYVPLVPKLN